MPIAASALEGRDREAALTLALGGGEDYERLMSGPVSDGLEATVTAATGIELTRIGRVVEGEGAVLEADDGTVRPLEGGFGHWSGSSTAPASGS